MNYDLIICGAGAGGLSAAIYACRAGLKTLVLEKLFAGGQAATTYEIDNYPGFDQTVEGPELAMKMEAHARKFGADIKYEEIVEIRTNGQVKKVKTASGEYEAKLLILAMGATPKTLGLEREQELRGKGVSYCATCDGTFYRGKTAAVVGGGNTALEDALFLSRFCEKVILIHRRDTFRGDKYLVDKVLAEPKIEVIYDAVVEKINGERVESLSLRSRKTGECSQIKVDGLFVAVGIVPESRLVDGSVEMEDGYIVTDDVMRTSVDGVYAVGDIRRKFLRQVVTAAADGAVAASHASQQIL